MDTTGSSVVKKDSIEWDVDWGDFELEAPTPQDQSPATSLSESTKNSYVSPPQADADNAIVEIAKPLSLSNPPTDSPPVLPVPSPPPFVNTPKIKELIRGERFDLSSVFSQNPQIKIELISMTPDTVKLIALGLEATEILAGSQYCVGPRVPSSPCGAISHITSANNVQAIQFRACILPQNIKRVEVSVVSADPALPIGSGLIGFRLIAGDSVIVESKDLDPLCASSKCSTILEIYERQGVWRLRMIGEVLAPDVQKLLALHGAKAN